MRHAVRERPLLAVCIAATAGVWLGGVLLSKLGRLAVAACVGYLANEVWHRDTRLDIDEILGAWLREARSGG